MSEPTKQRGLGVTALFLGLEDSIDQPELFVANVELAPNGAVTLHLDADEIDRDSEFELKHLVSAELGLPASRVGVSTRPDGQADEPKVSIAIGTFVPRQAVRQACSDVRARLVEAGHALIKSESASLEVVEGQIWWRERGTVVASIPELAETMRTQGQHCLGWGWQERVSEVADPLTSQGYTFDRFQWIAQLAEVEVETATGLVQLLRCVLASGPPPAQTQQITTNLREARTETKCPSNLNPAFSEPALFEVVSNCSKILDSQWVELNHAPALCEGAASQDSEPALIPVTSAILNAIADAVGGRFTDTRYGSGASAGECAVSGAAEKT